MADACGAAQSVVNGFQLSEVPTECGQPLAWSQAALAASLPVCDSWRRPLTPGTAPFVPLYRNPLIDSALSADESMRSANASTVGDLLDLPRGRRPVLVVRRLRECADWLPLVELCTQTRPAHDIPIGAIGVERCVERMQSGCSRVFFRAHVVVGHRFDPLQFELQPLAGARLGQRVEGGSVETALAAATPPLVCDVSRIFPASLDSSRVLLLAGTPEFSPDNVWLPTDPNWSLPTAIARACRLPAGQRATAVPLRAQQRLRFQLELDAAQARRQQLDADTRMLFAQRQCVPVSDVTRAMLKARLHSLRMDKSLDLECVVSRNINRVFSAVPLSLAERGFLLRLNIGRLPFGPRAGLAGRQMLHCPACQAPTVHLTNQHVTENCIAAVRLRVILTRWFAAMTSDAGGDMFTNAWSWALTPRIRSPVSVAAYLLAVVAKRCLHNDAMNAFAQQRAVLPFPALERMVRHLFVRRVLSARKSYSEHSAFLQRSSMVQRYAGSRPLGGRRLRPWYTCFDLRRIVRSLGAGFRSLVSVRQLDPVSAAVSHAGPHSLSSSALAS